ncbi:tRNA 2-thiouridine synthesizing protein E [Methylomarinovum caldicuralii]|uniref:Sulfurtransferase n=1 Tax=Methylomarinovum caldicuralii TaxID=438856 RepID=A0AAU9C022_9GAMM|nr:TusE/DsrC/DsvC family sulfur relay protein [Methylomarinovum caldicuralii]BCX80878.1 tRNA 2-thiouridine synthesizing protein E [Methylomarinovum caldicuralii]
MVIEKAGRVVETTEEGFLVDLHDWDEAVAAQLAAAEGIELDAARWEIVRFVRAHYLAYGHFPNMRVFVKAVAQVLGEEKGNSRYLHRLFPRGPLKYACKLAGLPKPPHCL